MNGLYYTVYNMLLDYTYKYNKIAHYICWKSQFSYIFKYWFIYLHNLCRFVYWQYTCKLNNMHLELHCVYIICCLIQSGLFVQSGCKTWKKLDSQQHMLEENGCTKTLSLCFPRKKNKQWSSNVVK